METFSANNTRVIESTPEGILANCLDLIDQDSIVLLLAVVEHLTPDEQILYLSSIWNALPPGQILVVAETPNFLALHDSHTFDVSFAHTTQGEHFERWLRSASPGLRFRDHLLSVAEMRGTEALLTERFRLGVGVTPQVFELALGDDLDEVIVADGFTSPVVDWFPLTADDRRLVEWFREMDINVPIGFARSVLSFVFRKPRNESDRQEAREWNAARRSSIQDLMEDPSPEVPSRGSLTDLDNRYLVERDRELAAVYSSRSWKVTKPLRALGGLVRRTRGG